MPSPAANHQISGTTPPPPAAAASLVIPIQGAYTLAALDFAETAAAGLGFDQREQHQVRLALEEMLDFIARMALSEPNDAPVTLSFEPRADGMIIRIVEKGLPLDIERLPAYTPDEVSDETGLDGLSLHIAKQVMDRIRFTNRGRDGLEAELFKHRATAHVQCRPPAPAPPAPDPDAPINYTIRPALESEALEISRCAFLTYGYSYEDYIYYPDQIAAMNQSGELRSIVATDTEGTVLGHCALKVAPGRPDRAELGVLFVRPELRRHGLGAALWKTAVATAREQGLQSLYARSVTGHRASQTIAGSQGFADCALILALFPRAVNLKNMGGMQQGKMSGMFQWLKLQERPPVAIDPPARYATLVTELYHRAGLELLPHTPPPTAPGAAPLLQAQRMPLLNVGMLEVEAIGADIHAVRRWIEINQRRLGREKLDVIYLMINLQQDGAAELADFAAGLGFIFSGIMPGAFTTGDALAMQFLNLPEDPFNQLDAWTETASLLRDAIQREWRALES